MKKENELDYVRQALKATPASEWNVVADAAKVAPRQLYNIVKIDCNPRYNTVHALYNVLTERAAKAAKPVRRAKVPA